MWDIFFFLSRKKLLLSLSLPYSTTKGQFSSSYILKFLPDLHQSGLLWKNFPSWRYEAFEKRRKGGKYIFEKNLQLSWNKESNVKAVWLCRWKDRWRRWRMTKMSTKSVIWPQKSHLLWQTDCFMRGRMIGLIICFAASNTNNLFCD